MSTQDNELENVLDELETLTNILAIEDTAFHTLFEDPAFTPIERKAVINRMREGGLISEVLHHFLRLLIDKGRIMLLPLIADAFQLLLDQRRNRVRATIKSAAPLDEQVIGEINKVLLRLCNKHVLTKTHILPELLGGIRVEVSDVIFDGTVRARMDALRSKLVYEV